MADPTQLARLAAVANLLRPDWPTQSIQTYLLTRHADRPFRDLAVALVACYTDPETRTPKRLEENGPWWGAVVAVGGEYRPTPPRSSEACPDHPSQFRDHCAGCRIDGQVDDDQADVDELGLRGFEAFARERARLGLTTTPPDRQDTA